MVAQGELPTVGVIAAHPAVILRCGPSVQLI